MGVLSNFLLSEEIDYKKDKNRAVQMHKKYADFLCARRIKRFNSVC
jgi:hypothetical protein